MEGGEAAERGGASPEVAGGEEARGAAPSASRLEAVPEALRDAIGRLDDEMAEPALAFFSMAASRSGTHQIVLETEDGAADEPRMQIVLKLDFDRQEWKRVRKKVRQ